MKKVKYIKNIRDNYLSEIFQSLVIKFAFVNKNLEQITTAAKCRDFLGDCLWSRINKTPVSVYGFNYDYAENPYDDNRLLLIFPSEKEKEVFLNNINILHDKEKQAKVAKTQVMETQNNKELIVKGSNYWLTNYWKFSLYTFYLKIISYKDIDSLKSPEDKYIKVLTKEKENVMLLNIRKKSKEEIQHDSIHSQHDTTGFYSLLKNRNPKLHKEIFGN